jgi:inner membrane protein
MRAGTHIVAGVAVGYFAGALAGLEPLSIAALGALGGVVAMVPDIDHPQSAIRRKTGVLGSLAAVGMSHRGITHTVPAVLLFGLLASLVGGPLILIVVSMAYASHLVLDACTPSGVPLLWPLTNRRMHLLPHPLWVRTGSMREKGVLLGMMALTVFVSYQASISGF